MKIVRYLQDCAPRYGVLEDDKIYPATGGPMEMEVDRSVALPLASVKLLPPVAPSKIVAIGPGHRAQLEGRPPPERPILWAKPATTVIGPGDEIVIPAHLPRDKEINHEAEIAIVIGRRATNVAAADAGDYILGYTCINDITMGTLSDKVTWRMSEDFIDGKVFDTFAPLGPVIATDLDTSDLKIQCRVNGELRQDSSTSDAIWPYPELIERISRVMTLLPGDIIATGTPPGSTPLREGDAVEVTVEGIGTLSNVVRDLRG